MDEPRLRSRGNSERQFMSDSVLSESNGIALAQESSARMLSQDTVNNIVAARLARQEEQWQRKLDEEVSKVRNSLPDKSAIAAEVRQELEAQYRKSQEEQQQAMFQTQFQRDKNQYQTLVKDIQLSPDEDEVGLFASDADKTYLPLQIVAGNLNMEDTAEIMKELARSPGKLAQALMFAEKGNFNGVKAMFKKISSSMKDNQVELSTRSKAAEPLSHLKASSGGSSNREMTLDDYKRDPSLRG